MESGYVVYFGEKPFYIVNRLSPALNRQTAIAGTIIANQPEEGAIAKTIRDMDLRGTKAVIILTDNVEKHWTDFQQYFEEIVAGGGLVRNESGGYLFIFRRGKWDLPKGKLDEGESIENCALREVMEETGLQTVQGEGFLCNTYHTYRQEGKNYLKKTVWYSMYAAGNQELTPQTEEDIEKICWLKPAEWGSIAENTYPAILDVLALVNVGLLPR